MNVLERLESLKSQSESLLRQKVEAQSQLDQVVSKLKYDVLSLKTDFGVKSIDEAKALYAQLQTELSVDLDKLEESMKGVVDG